MLQRLLLRIVLLAVCLLPGVGSASNLDKVSHILVIYLENRSFDNLFGVFPGANGVASPGAKITQRRLNGAPYKRLPQPEDSGPFEPYEASLNPARLRDQWLPNLPNAPFAIDGVRPGVTVNTYTRDLVHRFYTNRAQIHDGANDRYVAYSDAGGLVMGYYSARAMQRTYLWRLASENLLLDNFFQGTFGGSFVNHIWLVCGCGPKFPTSALNEGNARALRSELDADGNPRYKDGDIRWGDRTLTADDGKLTDVYAVNTMLSQQFNNGKSPPFLPPLTDVTIGDLLDKKPIKWAWYAGGFDLALRATTDSLTDEQKKEFAKLDFQWHHQPFTYFANFDPKSPAGKEHLKDSKQLTDDIRSGQLPPVAFYKPAGFENQHPGYSNIISADREVRRVVELMKRSPMKDSYAIIVTYDEFGGFFDHAKPPLGAAAGARADYFGPGPRIPTIVASPLLPKHGIDSTQYDTTSIAKLIVDRFGLEALPSARFGAVESLARAFDGAP